MFRPIIPALCAVLAVAGPAAAEGTAGKTPVKPPAADTPLPPDLNDILAAQTGEDPIVAVLADPAVQAQLLDLGVAQIRVGAEVRPALRAALAELVADPAARQDLAVRLREAFDSFGFTDPMPDQIARVGATILPGWAMDGQELGLDRIPAADLRRLMAIELAMIDSLNAQRCDSYLSPWAMPEERQTIRLSALSALPADMLGDALRLAVASALAHYRDDPPPVPLSPADEDRARAAVGAAVMATIDAGDDPDRLLLALSPGGAASPEDACTARSLILRTVLAMDGPEGELALRLIARLGPDGA